MIDIHDLKDAMILVVDDNPTNLETLSDYLTEFGFTVLLKQDGPKALELLSRKRPDIILLDIVMPGMDGFETCTNIKESPETQDIPIIFMSALSDTVDKVKGFEAGAVDYITKPFQHEEVLARVKTHLTIQRLQNDLHTKNATLQELLERERKTLERERKFLEDIRLNLSISLPHELRTPLNGILGFAQLLANPRNIPETDRMIEYAQRIQKSGLRLHRLVENALLYANLKLVKYAPGDRRKALQSKESVDGQEFIAPIAQKKAREVHREDDLYLELVPARIRISPDNFEKIVNELLENAFKFSQNGTPVHVKTNVNGHLCIFSITDQGRGMTEDQIASIGAYMQFDRQHYEQQGTGMGLIISYLLAQLEGGVLSIDSKSGRGTTISIVLNCHADSSESEQQQDGEKTAGVLVIPPEQDSSSSSLAIPPREELERLYELAVIAHIQAVYQQIDSIEQAGDQYAPFVSRIRQFADDYRLDLLQQFIMKHLTDTTGISHKKKG